MTGTTARIKSDIERYAEALEAMGLGEYYQAERAIGISGLNLVQLRHGCVQRLKAAYCAARGKRIDRDLLLKAHKLLEENGQQVERSFR